MQSSSQSKISNQLQEVSRLHGEFPDTQVRLIDEAAELIIACLKKSGKVIWFGNGGSATQSQHMSAEFVGRFQMERRGFPSIALTANTATVTAIGNDYGFKAIFSRQVEALAEPKDVAIGLSTSGKSPNVIEGLRKARDLRVKTIGLTGSSGGDMSEHCDVCICVPSGVTARIQELHLTVGHILCGLAEDALIPNSQS